MFEIFNEDNTSRKRNLPYFFAVEADSACARLETLDGDPSSWWWPSVWELPAVIWLAELLAVDPTSTYDSGKYPTLPVLFLPCHENFIKRN